MWPWLNLMSNPTPKPKRPRGRPKGSIKPVPSEDDRKVTDTHYLSVRAHRWLKANKIKIEKMACSQ
jgi:hypothetical protein